jgi:hypothetical protein
MSESVKELRRALQAKDREIAAFISKAWGLGDYPAGLDEKQRRRVEEEVGDLIEKHEESQEGRVAATPIGKLLQERHEIAVLLAGR